MNETRQTTIPYERQQDVGGNQMCGAAALCMVYRSLGVDCIQAELWRAVAAGNQRARTRLIAADCLERGFDALIVRAREPWDTLRVCVRGAIRVILNHRGDLGSSRGHYSVLVALDDDRAMIHDPGAGPSRSLRRSEFLNLWLPNGPRSEITGRILVAIVHRSSKPFACPCCLGVIPESTPCTQCNSTIRLQPAAVLGCADEDCPGRLWDSIYCPQCDTRLRQLAPASDESV
jgi:Papain-like cysteine protease AvrRpt2